MMNSYQHAANLALGKVTNAQLARGRNKVRRMYKAIRLTAFSHRAYRGYLDPKYVRRMAVRHLSHNSDTFTFC